VTRRLQRLQSNIPSSFPRGSWGKIALLGWALLCPAIAGCQAQIPLQPTNTTSATSTLFDKVAPQKNGVFTIDGLKLALLHKSFDWAPAYQRDLQPAAGYPQVSSGAQVVKGAFKTDSGIYEYVQELKQAGTNAVSYQASLIGTATKETRLLALSIALPVAEYRGQKVFFDDAEYVIPWWFQGQALVKGYQKVKRVRVPLKSGKTLAIEGDIEAYLEDNREYGSSEISLQIAFNPHVGSINESHLGLTLTLLSASDASRVLYNPDAKQPPRKSRPLAKIQDFKPDPALVTSSLARVQPLPRLAPHGENFVDAKGQKMRFWGMNMVAFYPDHSLAEKTADNLAALGINMARLHHNLRSSTDWAPADTAALVTYEADSRTPNSKAWDRYDYFNARLREKQIYLSVSLHSSRSYLPEDVSILKISAEDDEAWSSAMDDLNHWGWRKATDPRKMLPVFDERCFLLNAEFARYFLTRVNAYTGIAYDKEPQIASVELINEFSSEYTLTTGNVFPEYWTAKLNGLLKDYAVAHNVEPFGIYQMKSKEQQRVFSEFCNSLDEMYTRRMEKIVRETGYEGPIAFSNLWRGDANLRLRAKTDGFIEDHAYLDPLVVSNPNNFLYNVTKSSVVGKPVVIGEFNQAENPKVIQDRKPVLSMLPLAIAAYSSLQNHAGVIWFAWSHGASKLNSDGWGKTDSEGSESIGTLAGNSTLLDHMRSAGIVFKNGYVSPSVDPQTVFVDESYVPSGYNDLMNGQTNFQAGWQAIHSFRKAFGPVPTTQNSSPWLKAPPPNPAISDTKQIIRDSQRQQLTFSAPKAEGFSGYLDGKPAANLNCLNVSGDSGFATVIVVTLDDAPLTKAKRILLSRTYTNASGKGTGESQVILSGLAKGMWTMKVTRPSPAAPVDLTDGADGSLKLPATVWTECELVAR
jgi:hypothetical protein